MGPYQIVSELGRGGMAVVYLARQPALGRDVALKELAAFHAADESLAQRFIREARVAGSLSHPSVVTVFDFVHEEGKPYIAMEYLERGSLRPFVGALTLPQVVGVLDSLLAALAHAETKRIVHRDIKPENLLVTADGGVKIADFGIAKAYQQVVTEEMLTPAGATVGTPAYMAPEQAMASEVGPWTDLYQTGVVAFELLSGGVPFRVEGNPLAVMMQHISDPVPPLPAGTDPALEAWVRALLEKDPAARPASAREASESLEEIVVGAVGPLWRRSARLGDAPAAAAVERPRNSSRGRRTCRRRPSAPRRRLPRLRRRSRRAAGPSAPRRRRRRTPHAVRRRQRRSAAAGAPRAGAPPTRRRSARHAAAHDTPAAAARRRRRRPPTPPRRRHAGPPPTRRRPPPPRRADTPPARRHAADAAITPAEATRTQRRRRRYAAAPRRRRPMLRAVTTPRAGGGRRAGRRRARRRRHRARRAAAVRGRRPERPRDPRSDADRDGSPTATAAAGPFAVGEGPDGVAVGAGAVWAVSSGDGTLTRIDPATGDTTTVEVGTAPDSVIVALDSVWVTVTDENQVVRLTTDEQPEVIDVYDVGAAPEGIAATKSAIWTANSGDGSVSQIIVKTGKINTVAGVGQPPLGIAIGAGAVWVADSDRWHRRARRWRAARAREDDRRPRARPTCGRDRRPQRVGRHLEDGRVWRIDADEDQGTVAGFVEVGGTPRGLATDGELLYVTDRTGDRVVTVDPEAMRVVKRDARRGRPAQRRARRGLALGHALRRG